jgi:chromosome segregation ATPase
MNRADAKKKNAEAQKTEADAEQTEANTESTRIKDRLEIAKMVQSIAEESMSIMRNRMADMEKELAGVKKTVRDLSADNEKLLECWRDAMAALEQYFQVYSRLRSDLSAPNMRESIAADISLLEEMRRVQLRIGDGDTERLDGLLEFKRAQLAQCEAAQKPTIPKRSKKV